MRLNGGRQRFTNVLPLPDGGLVFSTAAPSLARIDAGGARMAEALPPNGDFRFDWRKFRLSADGLRVTLPLRADGAESYTFKVGARVDAAYRVATPADAAAGAGPLRTGTLRLDATLGDMGYKQPVRLGALTSLFLAFAYVGFAAPFVIATAAEATRPTLPLTVAAVLSGLLALRLLPAVRRRQL